MLNRKLIRKLLVLALFCLPFATLLKAADESYVHSLSGKIKKGDSCTVIDDKFLNLSLEQWNQVRNLSVNNFITFELRQDTGIYYYNRPFTCTLKLSVRYFTSRDQIKPSEINDISLVVRYDTATGKFYPLYDRYSFKNAFKVTVIVNSITSPEWGDELPAVFRIKNQILVQRKYPFSQTVNAGFQMEMLQSTASNVSTDITTAIQPVGEQLMISWDPLDFPGAEEYDVEWTFIDALSDRGAVLAAQGNGPYNIPDATVASWMKNDNSRVTVTSSSYLINLPFADGYIVARVRSASYDLATGIRLTSNWQYRDDLNYTAAAHIDFHEQELNWQYTVSFAEEGKRKEVISYFDGSMRSRQAVTITNSDNKAVIAETVYDKMGRPAVSILPAPVNSNEFKYYPALNKNAAGNPYSHSDISAVVTGNNCTISASGLNTSSGAAQYYSPNNAFIGDPNYYFSKYVPDSRGVDGLGYPFTLTEYTPDNTGRVRRQGGVGPDFKIGSGHETNYFYGKPLQSELDRLFGMEAGKSSHYLKNMVIDPNGQISVSYVNAAGKTVATALAGKAPGNVDELASALSPDARKTMTQILMRPADFQVNTTGLYKEASATFMAAVTGLFKVHYAVDPAYLGPWNGPVTGQQFCSNCYYDVEVTVKDDCGNVIATASSAPFQINSVTCNPNAAPVTQILNVPVAKIGEHTVSYRLRLSESVIKYQTDYYIANNIDLKTLQMFFHDELLLADLKSCYSECSTCIEKLGSFPQFSAKMNALLQKLKDEKYAGYNFNINSSEIQNWISTTYTELLFNCQSIAASCQPLSPCEQKLEQMKNDVRPGGQYLLYDPASFTVLSTESQVSIVYINNGVALHYKNDPQITNFSFTDDNGNIRNIKDAGVTEAEFIKAYLDHPEWANDFVKRHIEYCSYLWCKDPGYIPVTYNNEVSYTFDEKLREKITKGSAAVSAGYYSQSDYLQLSNVDPFFNGGRGSGAYKTQLQNDLANLSTVLKIRFKDQNNNWLPSKNIQQLIEWMLYCKPVDPAATSQDYINSWACSPDPNCRSLTAEWELFRNYYLKIKSKYLRLAKLDYSPSCENCFIGQDPLSAGICEDPGPVSDYSLFGGMINQRVRYKNGTEPFKGNYRIKLQYIPNGNFQYIESIKGTYQTDVIPNIYGDPIFNIIEVKCINGNPQQACNNGSGGGGSCYTQAEFYSNDRNCQFNGSGGYEWDECQTYIVRNAGPVTQNVLLTIRQTDVTYYPYTVTTTDFQVTLPAGQQEVYVGNSIYRISAPPYPQNYIETRTFGVIDVSCPPPTCPTAPDFHYENINPGNQYSYNPCFYSVDYNDKYYVHTAGPVSMAVNIRVRQEIYNSSTGTIYNYWWATIPAGQDRVYLGQYRYEWDDVNCNFAQEEGEITTYDYFVETNEINCDFVCPGVLNFTASSNTAPSNPCYGVNGDAQLTVTYTGTVPALPFPPDKLVTVYCNVGLASPVAVTIDNTTGIGTLCIPGNLPCCPEVASVACSNIDPPPTAPPSTCATDPRAPLYGGKIRIWNDYIDEEGYLNCFAANAPVTQAEIDAQIAASIVRQREQASVNLAALKQNWLDRLRSVVREENEADVQNGLPERFFTLKDPNETTVNATVQNLVNHLEIIAQKYIDIAPQNNIRAASSLPAGVFASNGYNNFTQAFTAIIGTSLMQIGFGPHLLNEPYPYDKTPVLTNPNISTLSTDICIRVTAMKNRWINAGSPGTFHTYLQQELGDDYTLTAAELSDLETRCTSNCKQLNEPLLLPAVFASPVPANPDHAWVDCSRINTLYNNFAGTYPGVTANSRLYRVLFANYMNANLGYAQTYEDYDEFRSTTCISNPSAVLYNKAAAAQVAPDYELLCVENIIRSVYDRAAQEYEFYIETERKKFRNAYISKCLSANASAKLEGEQYEYHYTLYYYDQSGNLVKTIPPEGVDFLSDTELELVEEFRDMDPALCTGAGIPTTENATATFNALSTGLQNTSTRGTEMWLYNGAGSNNRQVRIITPDNKYMYQAAISQGKLWVELYSLQTSGGSVDIMLSNHAVADVSALSPLQEWSHLQVQSGTNLTEGALQLYLDGRKLTNITGNLPPYPFDWEIISNGGTFTLPAQDLAVLKHFRIYDRTASDAEVMANYKNSCLGPVGALAVQSSPLQYWGRFNIPPPGGPTTIGPGSTVEYINRFIVPDHMLATSYAYNSLNQVTKQTSPDGGTSEFFYDRLGRLTISQNAEQKTPKIINAENPADRYSYTRYDALGRITEVGEKIGALTAPTEASTRNEFLLNLWLASGTNRQVTVTAYDIAPAWAPAPLAGTQKNLRKRVAASALLSTSPPATDPSLNRMAGSYYSYDIIGNVHTLVQENTALAAAEAGSDGLKTMKYQYDLVSGKVNKVLYQDGKWDQFYYQYLYDADNRVVKALSSRINYSDANLWITEASYRYYLHGPLARMELGNTKVQGMDYAYTLQGWLKGVNSKVLDPNKDMSGDGMLTGPFTSVARDVLGFSLGYFAGDYTPVGGAGAAAFGLQYQPPSYDPTGQVRNFETGKNLFNGNIGHTTYAIKEIENGNTAGYTYRYDQLNRITGMRRNNISIGATVWSNSSIIEAYKEEISYDANGNIKTYLRNGADQPGLPQQMDDLTYGYTVNNNGRLANNKLRHVNDPVAPGNYTEDIDGQGDDNYQYDNIGNLQGDNAEGLLHINWTVYGKIAAIEKTFGAGVTYINYTYDPSGNRIVKEVQKPSRLGTTTTYYVRDAQGNVMGLYEHWAPDGGATYTWKEQHLYGSSRVGMVNTDVMYEGNQAYAPPTTGDPVGNGIAGLRAYELSNHLGNVLAVINDIKTGFPDGHFEANVLSANDYYPFGMIQPGRTFSATNSYRYGFNGQENSDEIAPNTTTALYWEYDSRIGRRWNTDPVVKEYESPYLCFSGNPVLMSDPLGDDVSKEGPDHNPKTKRSLKKYERKYNKELKRLGGDTEENRKKAYEYMNQFDTKKWMWIRHTSMEHMPPGGPSDNGEIYYNAGDIFKYRQDKAALEEYNKQSENQQFIPLSRVGGGLVPSFDNTRTDMANVHSYQIPSGASGEIVINLNSTNNQTWSVLGVQNNKTRAGQYWSFYFESPLFNTTNTNGPQQIGPMSVNSKNGTMIHLVINSVGTNGDGSTFSDRSNKDNVQVYFKPVPPGPKPSKPVLNFYQAPMNININGRRLSHAVRLELIRQKYRR